VPIAPKLIADEASFRIWYKPAGLMLAGTKFGDHCAINRWVETNQLPQRPVFIVHRLDRFATGLMILAHTKQAAGQISEQFQKP
jgi:tRNA pseudouridine32 synthase / 23S rRNA pseudouridine746 synthase